MHPLLRRERLRELPRATRLIVAPDEIISLALKTVSQLKAARLWKELRLSLPFSFALLHPSRIPTADAIDEWLPETQNAVVSALSALELVLETRNIPSSAAPELWPRIFAWFVFFEAHYGWMGPHLEAQMRTSNVVAPLSLELMLMLYNFSAQDESVTAMLFSTPGFTMLLIKIWADLTQHTLIRNWETPYVCFLTLYLQDVFPASDEQTRLDEVLEGAGGTFEHLAELVVDALRWIWTRDISDWLARLACPI
ncbi:hypothetical protein C8F01DRAFT_1188863 [Mycena amicta]|nr:hypothetical protein C8F01DRAFT_1188863 [Mycena amicta]